MGDGILQASFNSGEIAPSLQGRIDFNRYYSGLKTCKNFIVRQHGGVCNRPGTKFIAETHDSTKITRLIDFQFSTSQTYVLEFGDYVMRIIKDGGLVVFPAGHASAGQVVEVVTIYPVAALYRIIYTQSADVITFCHPDYPPQQLSRTDHHLWSFAAFNNVLGPFKELNIDTSKTVYANGVSGNVTVTSVADIFTAAMVGQMLKIEQSPDSLTKKWEVGKTVTINDIKRAGPNYYQAVGSATTGTVRPDHTEGVGYDGDPGVLWAYLHSGIGIVLISGFTSAKIITGTVLLRLPDSVLTASVSKSITGAVAADPDMTPNSGDEIVTITCTAHGFVNGDSVTIASVVGMTDLNGVRQVTVLGVNTFTVAVSTAQNYTSGGTAVKSFTAQPSYKWALEAFGGADKYPGSVAYFQQRQIFGGSFGQPQTTWMSRTAGYTDFGVSVPILDDDAITFTTASRDVNEIRHFVELAELVILTSSGEWMVRGGQDGTLMPGAVSMKRQGYGGAAFIPPVMIGNHALYVQEKGAQVRSLNYSLTDDAFIGNDLTIMANHLFNGHTIVDWCFQRVPFQTVWAVRDDGVLLGLTYMPEHEVAGWHQHTTTGGLFESISCISEGQDDAVYCVVKRGAKRFIERFDTRRFTSSIDAFFVDCGLSYSGAPATSFSGLDHLEGMTVDILADGFVCGQQVVNGGSVTINHSASVVHIGIPIVAEIETLPISVTGQTIRDKNKLINHLTVMLEETSGLFAGPDSSHLTEFKQRETENYGEPVSLKTGMIDLRIQAAWNKNGQILIQKAQPLPITILAIIPEVSTGGS
jgi:hypothetical protein